MMYFGPNSENILNILPDPWNAPPHHNAGTTY